MRVLTVEECEALYDNLPQRRLIAVFKGIHVRITPWDHSLTEKPVPPPLILDIYVPKTVVLLNTPLYSHRYRCTYYFIFLTVLWYISHFLSITSNNTSTGMLILDIFNLLLIQPK